MINEIFQSLHEAVKKRNRPEDFLPIEDTARKDIIHRGYLTKTIYPIKYDMMPSGKTRNTGKHIYHFKSGGASGFLEIDHDYEPSLSGHETTSVVNFELQGRPPEDDVQIHRSFVVPAFMHHINSLSPDIIKFKETFEGAEDLIRRLGTNFEISGNVATRKVDPKFGRIYSHIMKSINNKEENKDAKIRN